MITSNITLHKKFIRPERYRVGLRLGFAYSTFYTLHFRVLFQLFKGFSSVGLVSLATLAVFYDFYNKSSLALFELYRLGLSKLSAGLFGFAVDSGCLQVLNNRFVGLCDSTTSLKKTSSCLISVSLPYFLNLYSNFLIQRTLDFHLRFWWFPVVSVLGNQHFRVLKALSNAKYLTFMFAVSFFELSSIPFNSRFLMLILCVSKLTFNFLIGYSFIFKVKINDNK